MKEKKGYYKAKDLKFDIKKIISIVIFIIIIIFIYFFIKGDYKKINIGNNVFRKSIEQVENYILNISSYKAKIEVEVQSNKNNNKYILMQKYISPNVSKQEVLEPSNIQGLQTTYDGANLTINNSNLGLSKIYENYQYMVDNCLWLNSFINDYNKSTKKSIKEENGEIVMETNVENGNQYIAYKKLYIDNKTYKPTKLVIQDINKKNLVYILYKEIEIDSVSKEEVLAFKSQD